MDWDAEGRRGKVFMIAAAAFLVSCFFTVVEFLYLVDSREATATVTKAYRFTPPGRFRLGSSQKLAVEYEFKDADGNSRSGRDDVADDWPLPRDGMVKVRYRPGPDGSSRLAGHVNWVVITIFFVGLTVVAIAGYRAFREGQAAYAKPKRKNR